MVESERIVIVGGSLAGVRAAETLRAEGFRGNLTVVDGDRHQPYDRYHLSKDYLEGVRDVGGISLRTEHIDAAWLQGRVARSLDMSAGRVELDDGSQLPFDGLIVATGSRPRQLAASAMALTGVMSLRTLADAQALRAALLQRPASVVIIGGGLIGSEIASITAQWNLRTTIVDAATTPLVKTLGPLMAESVVSLHERHGVQVKYGVDVEDVEGHNGSVRAVRLVGGEVLPAELVVICLGVTPNTDWLENSGLRVADGMLCDAALFARDHPNVVAAGDVARWPVTLCGPEPVRVEHWRSTLDQATRAAKNLLAGRQDGQAYAELPVFGTHIHGLHFRSNGFPPSATDSEVVWGDPGSDRYVVAFYRDD
ncbi:MAG: FAD-dependent oxidoreductase, partial [Pseudonocardiales bacterium]|nr:FAD-dependent oxidoreductase [Pseudonocardiales bacterium]